MVAGRASELHLGGRETAGANRSPDRRHRDTVEQHLANQVRGDREVREVPIVKSGPGRCRDRVLAQELLVRVHDHHRRIPQKLRGVTTEVKEVGEYALLELGHQNGVLGIRDDVRGCGERHVVEELPGVQRDRGTPVDRNERTVVGGGNPQRVIRPKRVRHRQNPFAPRIGWWQLLEQEVTCILVNGDMATPVPGQHGNRVVRFDERPREVRKTRRRPAEVGVPRTEDRQGVGHTGGTDAVNHLRRRNRHVRTCYGADDHELGPAIHGGGTRRMRRDDVSSAQNISGQGEEGVSGLDAKHVAKAVHLDWCAG